MRLVLRRGAKLDLIEARRWYEDQAGLGEAFVRAVEATLSTISEHPKIFPRVDQQIRRAAMDRFPYGVFYRIDGDTVRILAIVHHARDPRIWKGRR